MPHRTARSSRSPAGTTSTRRVRRTSASPHCSSCGPNSGSVHLAAEHGAQSRVDRHGDDGDHRELGDEPEQREQGGDQPPGDDDRHDHADDGPDGALGHAPSVAGAADPYRVKVTFEGPLAASAYEVLGVGATVDDDELRRAYRMRLRQTHPDTGGDAALFIRVQRAWEHVGTPEA